MSRATRQEVLIRSLIEALAITIRDKLQGQPRQKPKLEACAQILNAIENLAVGWPLKLELKEAKKVIAVLEWFHQAQGQDEELQKPEVMIAMALALGEKLWQTLRRGKDGAKVTLTGLLTFDIQRLYDTFDRQVKKLDLLTRGGELADMILAREL